VFHLATSYPFQKLFRTVLERLAPIAMPGQTGAG